MAYRTLLRFPRPLQVGLDLVGPDGAPRRVEGRVAGFGRDGPDHFVEMAPAGGRPAERLPLADIGLATRRGQEVELREVILSRTHRAAFRAGRRVQLPAGWHYRSHLHTLKVTAVVLPALWGLGLVLWWITGGELAVALTLAAGGVVALLAVLVRLIPPLWRRWLDLRLRFGLWF